MSKTLPSAQWQPHLCHGVALNVLRELHEEELSLQVAKANYSSPHHAASAAVVLVREMEARVERLRQTQTERETLFKSLE